MTMRTPYLKALIALAAVLALYAAPMSSHAFEWRDPLSLKNGEGNLLLNQGQYAEAIEAYKTAQVESPESPELHYNIGLAMAHQKKYDEAPALFDNLLGSDAALKSAAHYNIGVCKFRNGEQAAEAKNYQEAIEHYESAIDCNRQALKLVPEDADAKYNCEQARRALKILLDKLKNEQEQNPENQQEQEDQQEQDQKQEQDQDQNQGEDEQQQKQDEQRQDQNEQKDQESKEQEQQEKEQQKPEEQSAEQGEPPQTEELTEEQARRILNQLEEENAEAFRQLFRPQGIPMQRWENDW